MRKFVNGLLLGIGCGVLVAPMRGRDMRHLLSERVQKIRGSLPQSEHLTLLSQNVSQRTAHTIGSARENMQQATAQVKHAASNLSETAQQKAAQVKNAASNLAGTAQQTASQAKDHLSATVQQTAVRMENVASNLTGDVQQTASQAKNNLAGSGQQAAEPVKNAASTPGGTEQLPVSQVKQTSGQDVTNIQAAPASYQHVPTTPTANQTNAPTVTSPDEIPPAENLLKSIPGIEAETQRKLEMAGIYTTTQLLDRAASRDARVDLAEKAGIPMNTLKALILHADLMQLKDASGNEVVLLEEAGVTGCKDLQHRNPENLLGKLVEAQDKHKVVPVTPDLEKVATWVAQATEVVGTAAR